MTVWYRYEDVAYAQLSEHGFGGSTVTVELREYLVLKETSKGAWLDLWPGERRFAMRECRRRFACPTKDEAMQSFVARKRKQIAIYEARIRRAKRALDIVGVARMAA